MIRHCLPYSLFRHKHTFKTCITTALIHHHQSSSSSSSSSSSELLLAFSPIITSPFSQTNKRPRIDLVRWFGYIIFIIFYRWWLLFSYFLRQINRDDNIMQARRGDLGACSRAYLFVVWYACLLAINWMVNGWIALVRLR